ncbi:MAG: Fic family protein [Woeseiaceae bacterium]
MAKTGNQLLAEALQNAIDSAIGNIVYHKNIKPKQQALLNKNGYLKRIIKGWYLLDADLSAQKAGESALWYESMWGFIEQYLSSRFKDNYWLSSEASLDLLTDNNSMPVQIVVFVQSDESVWTTTKLPNNMSICVTNSKSKPEELISFRGLNLYSLESAIVNSTPVSYKNNPLSMQIALKNVNFDALASALISSRNIASAGRIIGAYEVLNMRAESEKLKAIILGAGYENIKIVEPFNKPPVQFGELIKEAASATRVRVMWQQMRQGILDSYEGQHPDFDFNARPIDETLTMINEVYVHDAYNSLSIEGYKVTPDLIERVSKGDWSPETIERDHEAKDALAARGYYDAFNKVLESITAARNEEDLNLLIDVGITQWYTSLFSPCVVAGIVSASDLAGFRKGPIYIRGSKHVPPASEQLMDCMAALKECIAEETSFPVKAILGHFFIGYIHPFIDGNGRTARFLMNFLFIVGGYNWVVIKQKTREQYMEALESASSNENVVPFVEFILKTTQDENE